MPLRVKLLTEGARVPERAYNSAGYDLFASEKVSLLAGRVTPVPTGIVTEFPDDYVALIWDRSSMGFKGLHVFGGVIDADYRGEWKVLLFNSTPHAVFIEQGTKIAQFLLQPIAKLDIEFVQELSATDRGTGGFGSTGA